VLDFILVILEERITLHVSIHIHNSPLL